MKSRLCVSCERVQRYALKSQARVKDFTEAQAVISSSRAPRSFSARITAAFAANSLPAWVYSTRSSVRARSESESVTVFSTSSALRALSF